MTAISSQSPTINPWLAHPTRIRSIKHEAPGIATYQLEFEQHSLREAYAFRPGQFNMLYLPGFGESAISISTDPKQTATIGHTVRVAGNVTQALARLKAGDSIGVRGPYGSAWPVEACRGCDLVLACGGVGLAPLRPVLYHVLNHRHEYGRVHLRAHNIEVNVTVDMGDEDWQGQIGVVPVLFQRLRLDPLRTRLMTCGPEIMMRFVVFEALARKLRHEHIYLSMERNMNCALGFCGHCQLGPEFVCKDGPVFTYERMEPFLNVEEF
jgi:NAD(P)H-flavin reductase